MDASDSIVVAVVVPCDVALAWQAFTQPDSIKAWHVASPGWHCPAAAIDLRPGGRFCYRMEARDGSMGFDYEGTFLEVEPPRRLRMALGPAREVLVEFSAADGGTRVSQAFTPDPSHPPAQQRAGWQAMMDHYAAHVAALVARQRA